MSVILRQSLAAECEPSRSPEVGMDPQEPEVLPVLRALPQNRRAGFLPHWEDQVSQVVFQKAARWNLWLLYSSHFTTLP